MVDLVGWKTNDRFTLPKESVRVGDFRADKDTFGFEDFAPEFDKEDMVKKNGSKKAGRKAPRKVVPRRKARVSKQKQPVFGPVTTIDTAPVSMGNTFQGAKPIVVHGPNGVRVRGRDYLVNIAATASSVQDWVLVAGCPITPACMVTSTIKGFVNAYAQYQTHAVAFHYITASSTANQGSVMFHVGKNRGDPGLDHSNDNFLPMVLSDNNTIIGPLWKNMTASYFPETPWLPTNLLNAEGLHEQASGELFVFTKTSDDVIPGFVLIDYDISFREMQANPKGLTLPVSRMKYTQVVLTAAGTTINVAASFVVTSGLLLDGTTASSAPAGWTIGDVYKIVINFTNASLGGRLATNVFTANLPLSGVGPMTVDDGFTCYGLVISATTVVIYSTYYAATSASAPISFGVTDGDVLAMPAFMSLCGAHDSALLQVRY
jgi:hypothetical protein